MRKLKHVVCGYEWTPRVAEPAECTNCHRPLRWPWDVKQGRLLDFDDEAPTTETDPVASTP